MDWARAIERNSQALQAIVATLFAMLGLVGDAAVARIPKHLHSAILRLLRPAESAVRRLIVIAARGVVVKLPPSRPRPQGLAIAGKGSGRISFQLFDTRKRFGPPRPKRITDHKAPRVWSLSDTPSWVRVYRPEDFGKPEPITDGSVDASRLSRRLMAIKQALEDLPRQAMRLARWRAKRERMASPKFRDPLRPGRPPGHREKPVHEVDEVLAECHWLAFDALKPDTS